MEVTTNPRKLNVKFQQLLSKHVNIRGVCWMGPLPELELVLEVDRVIHSGPATTVNLKSLEVILYKVLEIFRILHLVDHNGGERMFDKKWWKNLFIRYGFPVEYVSDIGAPGRIDNVGGLSEGSVTYL